MSLSRDSLQSLRCVECRTGSLDDRGTALICKGCAALFPKAAGAPILLRRDNPFFAAQTVMDTGTSGFNPTVAWIARLLPGITLIRPSITELVERGLRRLSGEGRRCLVIGGGDSAAANARIRAALPDTIVSDVVAGADVDMICDGHDLPFQDDTLDLVVITQVLEHVLDPQRVVEEISRALRPGGLVVATTPFMEQVHMGAHDFQRFTDLGHRWLFRNFEEIERGNCSGPGSALLWSIEFFARSLCPSYRAALVASGLVRLFLFWIKYADLLMLRLPGTYDAAGAYYFLGLNAKRAVIDPGALLRQYRGIKRAA
ncbi:MAG TPA: methyltransferase domain-containing protein [Stellaceae bacterium]|nr:methyltransferase domain-containing protein [Stellaceae bacterium]